MKLNRAIDMQYTDFFEKLHKNSVFDWYLEVGCRSGGSMIGARSKTIGVDPFFRIKENVIGSKPAFMTFQQKSDDFFADGWLKKLDAKIALAFLDGMHLIEFLLRDFINTEAHAQKGGVIMMHDCCPWALPMTTRDHENFKKGAWTGDVWKIIPILKEYRPDLEVVVWGCKPTGVVAVRGLDPNNQVLRNNYNRIVSKYVGIELENYGIERFNALFDYAPVQAEIDADFPFFANARQGHDAVLTPRFVSR